MGPVQISYYSDILCIWAYVANRRIDQLVETFGDEIEIDVRFCSVFADARGKLEGQWKKRGGYQGYNAHVRKVAEQFPHVSVHDAVWLDSQPRTSASPHLFVKAVEIIECEEMELGGAQIPYPDRPSTHAAWELRRAFFADTEDISDWDVHRKIAGRLGLDYELIDQKIRSSEAVARLAVDYDLSQKHEVAGSPTLIMNDGRQKLFGNVGYRLIEANVQELLHRSSPFEASWC